MKRYQIIFAGSEFLTVRWSNRYGCLSFFTYCSNAKQNIPHLPPILWHFHWQILTPKWWWWCLEHKNLPKHTWNNHISSETKAFQLLKKIILKYVTTEMKHSRIVTLGGMLAFTGTDPCHLWCAWLQPLKPTVTRAFWWNSVDQDLYLKKDTGRISACTAQQSLTWPSSLTLHKAYSFKLFTLYW